MVSLNQYTPLSLCSTRSRLTTRQGDHETHERGKTQTMLVPSARQQCLPASTSGDFLHLDGFFDLLEFEQYEFIIRVAIAVVFNEGTHRFLLTTDRHQETRGLGHELDGDEDLGGGRHGSATAESILAENSMAHVESHGNLHKVRDPPAP
jgi:hypothetical protein